MEVNNPNPNSEPTSLTPLKLLTYNVFMRPPGINEKGKDDYKNTRQRLISKTVVPLYDIVCFQELFTSLNTRRTRILKSAKDAGINFRSISPLPPLISVHKINSGLLTISRYNIKKTIFKHFKKCSGIDAVAYKGVLYSQIELPNQILHLFNTHLQATYGPVMSKNKKGVYRMKKHFRSRLNQIIELRRAITHILEANSNYRQDLDKMEDKEGFTDSILVTGDFNSKSSRNLPKFFFEKMMDKRAQKWINSHSKEEFNEFDYLVHILSNYGQDSITDFMKESYGAHPLTGSGFLGSGNRKPIPEEELDYFLVHSGSAIDFWFEIKPHGKSKSGLKPRLENRKSCVVRPFFLLHKNFDKLSDHHGVELNMEFELKELKEEILTTKGEEDVDGEEEIVTVEDEELEPVKEVEEIKEDDSELNFEEEKLAEKGLLIEKNNIFEIKKKNLTKSITNKITAEVELEQSNQEVKQIYQEKLKDGVRIDVEIESEVNIIPVNNFEEEGQAELIPQKIDFNFQLQKKESENMKDKSPNKIEEETKAESQENIENGNFLKSDGSNQGDVEDLELKLSQIMNSKESNIEKLECKGKEDEKDQVLNAKLEGSSDKDY